MVFSGNLHIENRDGNAHSAVIKAAWRETKVRTPSPALRYKNRAMAHVSICKATCNSPAR